MDYNITAVERDTGLSKDVLRVWERRYGFPAPHRDANGERVYPAEQVERLRTIKRLMDQGHRPGKLIAAAPEALAGLPPRRTGAAVGPADSASVQDIESLLDLIRRHETLLFQQAMQQRLACQGLILFVQDTVAPLTQRIGEAWEQGKVEVFEEHLYTELTQRLLRQAIANLPGKTGAPRILLTTMPEEKHVLGLLMVEALLTIEGAECIPLGTQMPLLDLAHAAEAHRAEVVALSFSSAFPSRQIPPLLRQLRMTLPGSIEIWAGGAGVIHLSAMPGIELLLSLDAARTSVRAWRAAHPPGVSTA